MVNRLAFKDGTAFKGTLAHANSADRTYTIPDRTGRVHVGPVEVVIPLSSIPDSFGNYAVKDLVANDVIRLNFKIPEREFTSLTELIFNGIVDGSSDTSGQKFAFDFDYAQTGEAHGTHTQANTATEDFTGESGNIVGVDMGTLPSIAVDDHVGLTITVNASFTGTFYGMSITLKFEN